uniref:Uncharacterized protein n=1 Tax=Rhizophora mucronata TaxID=61149 RepID=A0A2P2K202_RHIMU
MLFEKQGPSEFKLQHQYLCTTRIIIPFTIFFFFSKQSKHIK